MIRRWRRSALLGIVALMACKRDAPLVAPPEIGADEPSPVAVCEHMEGLRAKKTPGVERDETCKDRMITSALLDGRELWQLRGRCILDATSVDATMLCNAANQPSWPKPRARATEEQIRSRLRTRE